MSRTIVAGAKDTTPQRRYYVPEAFQGELEAVIWSCILDLWRLGRRWREIAPKESALFAWCVKAQRYLYAHPELPDIDERWATYRERNQRQLEIKVEVQSIEATAEQLRGSLVKHWERLHPRRKEVLSKEPGWPSMTSAKQIADDLWDAAKCGRPMPGGEPPF